MKKKKKKGRVIPFFPKVPVLPGGVYDIATMAQAMIEADLANDPPKRKRARKSECYSKDLNSSEEDKHLKEAD